MVERNVSNQEYSSKSELVNDLVHQARKQHWINRKLDQAEQGGFTDSTKAQILKESKSRLSK